MTQPHQDTLSPEIRAQVIRELRGALERLALDMPHADLATLLRMCIGFFAGVHSEHFGHAETAKTLIKAARLGLWFAQEELSSKADQREDALH